VVVDLVDNPEEETINGDPTVNACSYNGIPSAVFKEWWCATINSRRIGQRIDSLPKGVYADLIE
jgi:hypothetical protein